MNDLREVQINFQNYLLNDHRSIQHSIVQTEQVSVTTRLGIYKEAYQARLIESLAISYPIINAYLGWMAFQALACAYIKNHPSPYRSIRWFGDRFAEYLTHSNEAQSPYLAELAQLEWKMTLAFDASDMNSVRLEHMATIPPKRWSQMRLTPHPSLQRMNFLWNVVPIWQALVNNEPPPLPQKNSTSIPWLLWRHDYTNRYYELADYECWAIDAMCQQLPFGELCEGLCTWFNEQEVGMHAATLLKKWIQSGLITEITD